MARPAKKQSRVQRLASRTPTLEWIAAAIGLVLTLAAIGFIVWDGTRPDGGPPAFEVEVREIAPTPGGWRVLVAVRNLSGRPAASVEVTGRLEAGGQEVESSSLSLDYVPGRGLREGGLFFAHDPGGLSLRTAVEGYAEP